ncbi:YusU family protein [Cytobacillus sp. Hm23]|uniref:YusU family protein n=1 Tax=Bacillaceae TaxID=186817 RepID=UPI002A0F2E8A|nr:YusU family protein [Cytobacillus sp. IB215316]MDX8360819.1 YusU family protein [Cytobacillus sp. IB215316]
MEQKFIEQFDGLLEKYTDLLVGQHTPDTIKKVEMWALYTHIAKSMPALAKHWNEMYPDAKEEMKKVIAEIKQLNEEHRTSK